MTKENGGGLSTEMYKNDNEAVEVKFRSIWKGKKLDETDSKEFRTNLKDHKANFSGDDYARLLQEFPFLPNRFVITHCNSDYFVKSELGLKYDWDNGQDANDILGCSGHLSGSKVTGGDVDVFVRVSILNGKPVCKVEAKVHYFSDCSTNQVNEEDMVEFTSVVYIEDESEIGKLLQKIGVV